MSHFSKPRCDFRHRSGRSEFLRTRPASIHDCDETGKAKSRLWPIDQLKIVTGAEIARFENAIIPTRSARFDHRFRHPVSTEETARFDFAGGGTRIETEVTRETFESLIADDVALIGMEEDVATWAA
jgi:hypothetical protein